MVLTSSPQQSIICHSLPLVWHSFCYTTAARTFDDYAIQVFLPYINAKLQQVSRLDIVWDQYHENSLTSQARNLRGKTIRKRVHGSTCVPKNWQQFLRDSANKTELFTFLVKYIKLQTTSKQLASTNGSEVVCIPPKDTTHLAPCNHEEADTRIFLHLADAVHEGFHKILLRTVDSDVVVLCVAVVAKVDVRELWIAFGTGKHIKYIPAHEIAASLGPNKSQALPMFHAYTGCDIVSSFATRGKKTAWDAWKAYEEATPTLLSLSVGPAILSDQDIAVVLNCQCLFTAKRVNFYA